MEKNASDSAIHSLYSLNDLVVYVDGLLVSGSPMEPIFGLNTLQEAQKGDISFFHDPRYLPFLEKTKASAVIIDSKYAPRCPTAVCVVENPYYAFAQLTLLFEKKPPIKPHVHQTAVVDPTVVMDDTVFIGAYCVIGPHTQLGSSVCIEPGCVIGSGCRIGAHAHLFPRVTLYPNVQIGQRCRIHSGAVLGSDGFGFAPHQKQWHRVAQLGGLIIEDDVDIGANTTVDRGTLQDTLIEKGCKLDNQIQIGHNVSIGQHSIIAGCSAIAGSTTLGPGCVIGGRVSINGHIQLPEGTVVAGTSSMHHSPEKPGLAYSSTMPAQEANLWRKNLARFKQLDSLARRLHQLENQVEALNANPISIKQES